MVKLSSEIVETQARSSKPYDVNGQGNITIPLGTSQKSHPPFPQLRCGHELMSSLPQRTHPLSRQGPVHWLAQPNAVWSGAA